MFWFLVLDFAGLELTWFFPIEFHTHTRIRRKDNQEILKFNDKHLSCTWLPFFA